LVWLFNVVSVVVNLLIRRGITGDVSAVSIFNLCVVVAVAIIATVVSTKATEIIMAIMTAMMRLRSVSCLLVLMNYTLECTESLIIAKDVNAGSMSFSRIKSIT